MANLARILTPGINLHPRETQFGNAPAIAAANSEVIIDCDGCASFALDMRGTFSLTMEVSGTVDGVNWQPVPMKPINLAGTLYVLAAVGATQGTWVGECFGFRKLRARCTAFTSGSANVTLSASLAALPVAGGNNMPTNGISTTVGASGAATTLTIASPGAGLRPYLTKLSINRFAAAVLTASATPVTVTTTNLPGTLAFTFPADALTLGQMDRWREDFTFPLASNSTGVTTTVVCPATTGVIWRITAGYFVAP